MGYRNIKVHVPTIEFQKEVRQELVKSGCVWDFSQIYNDERYKFLSVDACGIIRGENLWEFSKNTGLEVLYNQILGENKMNKDFTKEDLKTGMKVFLRTGDMCIVMKDAITNQIACPYEDILFGLDNVWALSSYNNDLTKKSRGYKQLDIDSVIAPKSPRDLILGYKAGNWEVIWERKEKEEMTIDQIEKALGKKIKIVGDI